MAFRPPLRLLVALLLSAVGIVGLMSRARVFGEQVIQFLDEEPLVFKVSEEGIAPTSVRLDVIVSDARRNTTVSLETLGPSGVEVTINPSKPQAVQAGRASFEVTPVDGVAGSGFLVATTSQGAVARKPLTFELAGEKEKVPIPSALTFIGWHHNWRWFSERTTVDAKSAAELGVSDSGDPVSPRKVLGIVVAPNGEHGEVVLDGGRLDVYGIRRAGEYTGKIDLTPGVEGGEADVTVKVRDIILWPLVALFAGLAIVLILESFTKFGRPGYSLLVRLTRIREQARSERRVRRRELKKKLGAAATPGIGLPMISERSGKELLLDAVAERAYADWVTAVDQAERDAWKAEGEFYKTYRGLFDTYAAVLYELVEASKLYVSCVELASGLGEKQNFVKSPVIQDFVALLQDERITRDRRLKTIAERATALLGHVGTLRRYLERLKAIGDPAKHEELRKLIQKVLRTPEEDLADLRNEISGFVPKNGTPTVDQADVIERELATVLLTPRPAAPEAGPWRYPLLFAYRVSDEALAQLRARSAAYRTAGSTGLTAVAGDTAVAELLEAQGAAAVSFPNRGEDVVVCTSRPERLEGLTLQAVGDVSEWLGLPPAGIPGKNLSSEEQLKKLRRVAWMYRLLGWLLVIAGGLALLYLAKPGFGSLSDYLTIFVWGTALGTAGEAVKRYLMAPG